jgi:2-polyprenyl-3-methyl-5-hydroxy-6-metoxy-1,4-benzoquinol methylase
MNKITEKKICRVCKSKKLSVVFDFGPTPLANSFITKKYLEKEEEYFPLKVVFCNSCTFLQLAHVVNPQILFDKYVYFSSTSNVFIDHFEKLASKLTKELNLDKNSFIVDIGSNDGILLKPFKSRNIKILGIEPARNIADIANKQKIKTICSYFSTKIAKEIKNKFDNADIITATNVFAHIDNLDEIIRGVKILIKENGLFIIEVPYLIDFIEKFYFDLVYHEHLSYWRVETMKRLFLKYDMNIIRAERVNVHGGSLRLYISKNKNHILKDNSVESLIKLENKYKLNSINTYLNYYLVIQKKKLNILNLLYKLKLKGKSIAGYGAPAKGNTLINYFNIDSTIIDFIIDDSPWKQGLYTPGKRIKVENFDYLNKQQVDYLLIFAWNFSQSIINKNNKFINKGGKFIIPLPEVKII